MSPVRAKPWAPHTLQTGPAGPGTRNGGFGRSQGPAGVPGRRGRRGLLTRLSKYKHVLRFWKHFHTGHLIWSPHGPARLLVAHSLQSWGSEAQRNDKLVQTREAGLKPYSHLLPCPPWQTSMTQRPVGLPGSSRDGAESVPTKGRAP